jgi:hypothetical protein
MIKSCNSLVFRNRLRTCLSAALALLGLASISERPGLAAEGDYGTIKGRLVWGGSEAPAQKALVSKGQATKDPAVCAAVEAIPDTNLVVDPKTNGVKYAFVYLVKPNGENPAAVKALVAKKATVVVDTAALVVVATPVVAEAALLFVPLDEHAASSATHHTTHTPVPHLRRMPRPFVSSGHQSTCIRSVRIDPIQIE